MGRYFPCGLHPKEREEPRRKSPDTPSANFHYPCKRYGVVYAISKHEEVSSLLSPNISFNRRKPLSVLSRICLFLPSSQFRRLNHGTPFPTSPLPITSNELLFGSSCVQIATIFYCICPHETQSRLSSR